MGGKSKLFHADGPIVIEKTVYVTAGNGSYIGDYIAGRTTSIYPISLDRAVTLAVYILEEAKKKKNSRRQCVDAFNARTCRSNESVHGNHETEDGRVQAGGWAADTLTGPPLRASVAA
jgi:hypothetical protein